jgi:hypothetical protein
VYLWLIQRVPDRYESQLRDAATTVRHRRLRIRLFRERWIRRSRRSVLRSERAWMRRIRRMQRSKRTWMRRIRRMQRSKRTWMRRSVLRSKRTWMPRIRRLLRMRRMRRIAETVDRIAARARRSLRLATLPTQQRRHGAEHNDDSISQHDQQVAEQLAWTPRGRIARANFPATVRFPGDGEFVVIDATGHPTAHIVACQDRFPRRFLVVTDAPTVGALRTAGIPYEYLPTASAKHPAETFLERLLWLDYVYGIDRIERLDRYKYPQQT